MKTDKHQIKTLRPSAERHSVRRPSPRRSHGRRVRRPASRIRRAATGRRESALARAGSQIFNLRRGGNQGLKQCDQFRDSPRQKKGGRHTCFGSHRLDGRLLGPLWCSQRGLWSRWFRRWPDPLLASVGQTAGHETASRLQPGLGLRPARVFAPRKHIGPRNQAERNQVEVAG